ncbi:MAG: hypothetical protein HQL38_09780 [Alphaproteobacteria bacterium]|nr:hypothetical protein [Alphaproteobacteria bacterium]
MFGDGRRAKSSDHLRRTARIYVDALAERLDELSRLATQARTIRGYSVDTYPTFKAIYYEFLRQSDEYQGLSYLAQEAIAALPQEDDGQRAAQRELADNFRQLQVPMLREVIRTNFRLLRIWEDRVTQGVELPLDSRQAFLDCVRVIHEAKSQLQREEYAPLLDPETLEIADRAKRLLETLLERAPNLVEFLEDRDRNERI